MNFRGYWEGRTYFTVYFLFIIKKNVKSTRACPRVSDPMLNPVQKSGHILDYLNFWALLDFFLWSVCWNLCNLALVKWLLISSLPNLNKSKNFWWSNYGTKGVEHRVTYPILTSNSTSF